MKVLIKYAWVWSLGMDRHVEGRMREGVMKAAMTIVLEGSVL